MLDRLIMRIVENGLQKMAYDLPAVIAVVAALIFCLWYGYKLHYKVYKSILAFLFVIILGLGVMKIVLWMNEGFWFKKQINIVVAFTYIPLIAWLGSKMLRESYDSTSDFMAFPIMIFYGIGRFGCVFAGCCHGYPCSWGIYNPRFGYKVFPVQILETLVAFGFVALMLYLSAKRKFIPNGELLPMVLTVYGASRFLIEFLHANEKVLLGCSKIAFHALFMCAVGAVLWTLKRKKNKKTNENGGHLCAVELQN